MWQSARRVLVGIEHDPVVVGTARAALLYALPIGVALAVAYLRGVSNPAYAGIALALIPVLRAVESVLDQTLKSSQNSASPAPPAGQSPPTP